MNKTTTLEECVEYLEDVFGPREAEIRYYECLDLFRNSSAKPPKPPPDYWKEMFKTCHNQKLVSNVTFFVTFAIFATGLVGNIIGIRALCKRSVPWSPVRFYLVSLAVVDILYIGNFGISRVGERATNAHLAEFLYRSYYIVLYFTFMSNSSLLFFASVNNYVRVCHPTSFSRFSNPTGLNVLKATAWVTALCMAVPITVLYGCSMNLDENRMCYWPYDFLGFIMPVIVTIGLNVMTIQRVRRRQLSNADAVLPKMLIVLTMAFFLCWTPERFYQETFLKLVWFWRKHSAPEYEMHLLMDINSAIKPFIYAIYSKEFRREFSRILCCIPAETEQSEDLQLEPRVESLQAVTDP